MGSATARAARLGQLKREIMRIDQLIVERELSSSRAQAQRLIAAGVQWRLDEGAPWRRVAKNGDDVPPDAQIDLLMRDVPVTAQEIVAAVLPEPVQVEAELIQKPELRLLALGTRGA